MFATRSTVFLIVLISHVGSNKGNERLGSCDSCVKEYTCADFKREYKKTYKDEEVGRRCRVLNENLKKINDHNLMFEAGNVSFTKGVNEYADMTDEEISRMLLGRCDTYGMIESHGCQRLDLNKDYEVPKSFSWVDQGVVTPVKNQGDCGACWAFTAVGAIEGQMARRSKRLTSLSVQQLIDCGPSMDESGCSGGNRELTLFNLSMSAGLMSEDAYPYEAKKGECRFDKSKVVTNFTSCYTIFPRLDEEILKIALYRYGPIAASIWATPSQINYRRGVFEDNDQCINFFADHAVLLVGYGRQWGKDYWLIKNSWGPKWGENGYMKLRRNKDSHCAIAWFAFLPTDVAYVASSQEDSSLKMIEKSSNPGSSASPPKQFCGLKAIVIKLIIFVTLSHLVNHAT